MKDSRGKALLVLATLFALNNKYGKLYCYPSQLTLMALLAQYHNSSIAIATVNRWLRMMEDVGYIIRVRRIRRDKRRGITFSSTLYKITLLGYHALKRTGASVWKQAERLMKEGMKQGQKALGVFTGPHHISTVFAAMTCFRMRRKIYILEKE